MCVSRDDTSTKASETFKAIFQDDLKHRTIYRNSYMSLDY